MEGVTLLWDVVRAFIVFIIPVITGIGLTIFSRICLPPSMATWGVTIFCSLTIGFVFLNLTPLNDAINNYLNHKMYQPKFVNCPCSHCVSRIESGKQPDEEQTTTEGATKGNEMKPEVVGNAEKTPTDESEEEVDL